MNEPPPDVEQPGALVEPTTVEQNLEEPVRASLPAEIPSRPATIFRTLARVGLAMIPLVIIAAVVSLVDYPLLDRLPADDHWYYLIDTVNYWSFGDLVSHTCSWNRTRQIAQGDGFVFRPVFFTILAAEKALFGYRVELWQIPGFLLHILLTYLLYLFAASSISFDESSDPSPATGGRPGLFHGVFSKACALSVSLFFSVNPTICEQVAWSHINPYFVTLLLLCGSAFCIRSLVARMPACQGVRDGVQLLGAWMLLALAAFNSELGIIAPLGFSIALAIAAIASRFPMKRSVACVFMFLMIPVVFEIVNLTDLHFRGGAASVLDPEAAVRAENAVSWLTASNSWTFIAFSLLDPFLVPGEILGGLGLAIVLAMLAMALLPKVGQSWMAWRAIELYPLLLWLAYGALTVYARMNTRGFRPYYAYTSLFLFLLFALPLVTRGIAFIFARTRILVTWIVTAVIAGTFLAMTFEEAELAYRECVRFRDMAPMRVFNISAPAPVLREYVRTVRALIDEHKNDADFSIAQDPAGPAVFNVPICSILFREFEDTHRPKYFIAWDGAHARVLARQQYLGLFPGHDDELVPRFVRCAAPVFNLFESNGKYFGLAQWAASPGAPAHCYALGNSVNEVLASLPPDEDIIVEALLRTCLDETQFQLVRENYQGYSILTVTFVGKQRFIIIPAEPIAEGLKTSVLAGGLVIEGSLQECTEMIDALGQFANFHDFILACARREQSASKPK